jgi:hypothetical protein
VTAPPGKCFDFWRCRHGRRQAGHHGRVRLHRHTQPI